MKQETIKQMQAFLSQKVAKGEFTEEQLDKLTDIVYAHDGSTQGMLSAMRQQESEFTAWVASSNASKNDKREVKPMSDEEIEALAEIF